MGIDDDDADDRGPPPRPRWNPAEHDAVTKVGPMPIADAVTARVPKPPGHDEQDTALVALPDEAPKRPAPVVVPLYIVPEEPRRVGLGVVSLGVLGLAVAIAALVFLLRGGDEGPGRGVDTAAVAAPAAGPAALPAPATGPSPPANPPAPRALPPPTTTASAAELVRAGNEALVQGLGDRAEGYYLAATRADEQSAAAWRGLGASRELRGDRPGALAAYRRYLELAPDAPDAMTAMARIDQLSPPPPPVKRQPRRRRRGR